MKFDLRVPTNKELEQIRCFINELKLDDRNLQRKQFIAAFDNHVLVGFGRLMEHADCMELSTLGVIAAYRNQGIGKALVTELIKKPKKNIYVVGIIPDFFRSSGFQIVEHYPLAIQKKMNYCVQELAVPETYVAMLLKRDIPPLN